MQPSESQRDTNKSSFAIFLLKLALQAIEKKVEESKENMIKILEDKEKLANKISDIEDKELRKEKLIQILKYFSQYLNLTPELKKLKEKIRNMEETSKSRNNLNDNNNNVINYPVYGMSSSDNQQNYNLNAKKNIDNDENYCPVEEKFSNVENDNNNINDKNVKEREQKKKKKKGDINNNMNINSK